MKKIALSLATIAAVVALAVTATGASWDATKKVSNNVFETGTLSLGETSNLPVSFKNLYPGAEVSSDVLGINYTGTVPADIYYGLKFTPGHDNLEDVLSIQIETLKLDNGVWVHNGWLYGDWTSVKAPFATWTPIATNISTGWTAYKLYVRMSPDANNDFQNKRAVNDIVFYAVQKGGSAPSSAPCVGYPVETDLLPYCTPPSN